MARALPAPTQSHDAAISHRLCLRGCSAVLGRAAPTLPRGPLHPRNRMIVLRRTEHPSHRRPPGCRTCTSGNPNAVAACFRRSPPRRDVRAHRRRR
ncbi:MAG: hypothetical protein AVDCRST_MAG68-4622 [uncultured Gemmatimonadetes bacterium]|uniref:Uncharacterized protein n=1 Tax=uncultured Gemmatimonadota bacterium TaxID=203437 RepID=A0A6J4MM18_9BACT|nr:MAG: hypothetical protein AVDCRST_MAG68-4622 [uncultured Gemmatimonadota bacterium]